MTAGNRGDRPWLQKLTRAASAMAILWALLLGFVVVPGGLRAQAEVPCEYDDGTDEWACVEMSHVFMQECEGLDCYSGMEFCCMVIEIE